MLYLHLFLIQQIPSCYLLSIWQVLIKNHLILQSSIVFDKTGKLNGRGAYVCRDDGCWDDDVYRGKLQAALKIEIDDSTFKLLYRSINSDLVD